MKRESSRMSLRPTLRPKHNVPLAFFFYACSSLRLLFFSSPIFLSSSVLPDVQIRLCSQCTFFLELFRLSPAPSFLASSHFLSINYFVPPLYGVVYLRGRCMLTTLDWHIFSNLSGAVFYSACKGVVACSCWLSAKTLQV